MHTSQSNPRLPVTRDERLSQFYPLILELHEMTSSACVLERILQNKLASIESYLIRQCLEEHGWNVSNTARALGLTRQGLQKKMRKHELSSRMERRP